MRRLLRIAIPLIGLAALLIPTGTAQAAPRLAVGGGSPIVIDGKGACTVTTVGHDRAGRFVGITAGHCGNIGSRIQLEDKMSAGIIGRVVAVDKSVDYAVIALDSAKVYGARNFGGSTIARTGTFPGQGVTVCKSGRTTGRTCGPVLNQTRNIGFGYVCGAPGDSGAPVVQGNRLVGMLTGGQYIRIPLTNSEIAIACAHPAIPVFTPMVATKWPTIATALDRSGGPGAGFRPI
ncbi:S1 family peptidase [Gordonia sp. NPDC003376]